MNLQGRWRIVKTPGYDMSLSGACIQFDEQGGVFTIDCLTGTIESECEGHAAEFDWQGSDDMREVTIWSPPPVMAGPKCREMGHSRAKSAS